MDYNDGNNGNRYTRRHYRNEIEEDHDNDKHNEDEDSYLSSSTSSSSNFDYRQWTKKRARMLAKERAKFIAQWKAEAEAEARLEKQHNQANRWPNRCARHLQKVLASYLEKALRFLALSEMFFSNLPLTTGATALTVVTLGVVWFKFTEMNTTSCKPVDFHSPLCAFREFPGCFECDTNDPYYRIATSFLYTTAAFGAVLVSFIVLRTMLAFRSVVDELSSPTTASPAGLICMTIVVCSAGQGVLGQILVTVAASLHFLLTIWFLYMAVSYNILPDPSWYPNTVGLGLSAIKVWLYYPRCGTFLMSVSNERTNEHSEWTWTRTKMNRCSVV